MKSLRAWWNGLDVATQLDIFAVIVFVAAFILSILFGVLTPI